MRNLNLALTWYISVTSTLVFSLLLLTYFSFLRPATAPTSPRYQMYQALPSNLAANTQSEAIGKTDARTLIVSRFFRQYNSPLSSMAEKFIEVADKYNLDFKLLPAIAMQESNGGKVMPNNSYNPFGYGIYGGQVIKFTSFEEAIEKVGRGLRRDYLDQGLKTPVQIMAKYTPPSFQKGGSWAIGVTSFIAEIY